MMKPSTMPAICAAIAILACSLAGLAISGEPQKKLPPDYEKKREAIRNFEAGVVPLFVLGDVNEDGAVNQEDLRLLRAYVAHTGGAGISCLAASDVDDNGSVDAKDITMLEQILAKGPVQAPPLSAHSRLGCDFKNFFIATRPQGRPGDAVPIHFLDRSLDTRNSRVTLHSGPGTVVAAQRGFIVQIAKSAQAGSIVTVSITLPNNRKYFYSFRVVPAP
jgi:hypothetical protein